MNPTIAPPIGSGLEMDSGGGGSFLFQEERIRRKEPLSWLVGPKQLLQLETIGRFLFFLWRRGGEKTVHGFELFLASAFGLCFKEDLNRDSKVLRVWDRQGLHVREGANPESQVKIVCRQEEKRDKELF